MQFNTIQQTTNPMPLTLIMIQVSTLPGLTNVIALMRNGLKFLVEDRHKLETTTLKVTKKSLQQNKGHMSLIPYCTNQNVCLHTAHKLIYHSRQISQHYPET
jgi:hypothetical protein